MKLTFLGTNGWFDSDTGHTPSALLETKDYYIIFDAGFGLAKANEHIKENKPVFLFLSHFHIDHICGLHALPSLDSKQGLTIFGRKDLKKLFKTVINHPYTASLRELNYKINLVPLREGDYKEPFNFSCRQLKHTDSSLGYRLHIDGKIIVYCSDTAICDNDYFLAKDADLLIHECTFVSGETSTWGHSNPEEVAKLASQAGVKKLVLTHFGPARYKTIADRKQSEIIIQKVFPNAVAATDGLNIEI